MNIRYELYHEERLGGRYITLTHLEPLLEEYKAVFEVKTTGLSVNKQPLYTVIAGNGPIRIYMWSQMHGNESTTTKAIFDFLKLLASADDRAAHLLEHFTFLILPMVNPDGAAAYTRVNANGIDLNRDSVQLSQPESRFLREQFEAFSPHYCYNLHDQRTIFGVGHPPRPATVSFLAPSYNDAREVNHTRATAMRVISAMNNELQTQIPGQVGRFDDSFNINCIGDMFQSLGVPTVLFEAGHFQGDYSREQTRRFIFFALIAGFTAINENVLVERDLQDYFIIPQNRNVFYDLIYKNVKINYENKEIITNIASQYEEHLFDDSVKFTAVIKEIGKLKDLHAHKEYDAGGASFIGRDESSHPKEGDIADFSLDDGRRFANGTLS